jgi:hypothetical protein
MVRNLCASRADVANFKALEVREEDRHREHRVHGGNFSVPSVFSVAGGPNAAL